MKTTFLGMVLVLVSFVSCRQEVPLEWSETPYLNVHSPWVDSTLQTFSIEEKIGQLIYLELDGQQLAAGQLDTWRSLYGGFQIYGMPVGQYREICEALNKQARVALFQGTEEQVLLNDQFSESAQVPVDQSLNYFSETDSLRVLSRKIFDRQMEGLGINAQFSPYSVLARPSADLLAEYHLQFVKELPADQILHDIDTAFWDTLVRDQLLQLQNWGVAGFSLEDGFLGRNELNPHQLADLFRHQLAFNGLLVAEAGPESALPLLAGTVDMLRVKNDPLPVFKRLQDAYQKGVLSDRELNIRVAKILRAKEWLRQQQEVIAKNRLLDAKAEITYDRASVLPPVLGRKRTEGDTLQFKPVGLEEYFNKNHWRLFNRQFYEKAGILLQNRRGLLPFKDLYRYSYRLVHLGKDSRQELEKTFAHYSNFSKYYHVREEDGRYPPLRINASKREVCIVTLAEKLDAKTDSVLLADLKNLASDREVVLIHFGDLSGLQVLDSTFTILHFPDLNPLTQSLAGQILFGGASPQGRLPEDINAHFRAGQGERIEKSRLAYQYPEAEGIAPEKLVGIDAIAQSAIAERAIPGCQVLVTKGGSVVYSKAFGFHDFEGKREVRINDLYDVASITKVAATTLVAMKLFEQGKFEVNDRLKNLMDCPPNSTIRNIQLKKLLIHQSGLQPHMPVIPYLLFRDTYNVGCDSFFCSENSESYAYQVADHFYFSNQYHQKIWEDLHKIPVRSQRWYRYSDVNFILVQQVLEQLGGLPLDDLVQQYFYTPLGLRHSTYRPLEVVSRDEIVPTQLDERWRQQLVHGYVHDETAALMGGVAGHAGLFANAEDLAVIFQMLLNGGAYGDHQFLQPETIDLFTTADHGNHRGYGFDTAHPDSRSAFSHSASKRTFGHTGFTGTCVWADPENDLIFIFLSNRINPDIKNKKLFRNRVRERIHQVVYDALDSYRPQELAENELME